jgi:Pectate lyase
MKRKILSMGFLMLALAGQSVFAQYPDVPKEDQKRSADLMAAAEHRSDSIWNNFAYPIVHKEAQNGRPYVPWAHRPDDLNHAKIPAFPGAEGGGAYTAGGRGGKVIAVTTLADDGPGSLREACETGGARIVIFKVSGIIRLKSPLSVRAPYITIAGQTAPGDGICVAGESFWVDTHDVIIRHMRFRRGETWVGRRDDAIGGNPMGNIMIDHVSASWGLDENMSMYRHMYDDHNGKHPEEKLATVNITIQNSIFEESLDTWNHAFGSTLGGENCSFIRNLWANNACRNPSIGWYGIFNFANNVVFNWVRRSIDGGDYRALYNIMNNYFKPGPATPVGENISHRILKPESGRSKLGYKTYGRCFVNGNIMEGNDAVTKDNWNGGVQVEEDKDCGKYTADMKSNEPFPMPKFNLMPTNQVFDYVLANAGATLPKRDAVDSRVTEEVRTGKIVYNEKYKDDGKPQFKHRQNPRDSYKQGIITDIAQVGGYPVYKSVKPLKDTDNDGMPDEWEIKNGLNPKDASDAVKDCNGDGYTNIEKYINGIDPSTKVDWTDWKNNFDTLAKKGGLN